MFGNTRNSHPEMLLSTFTLLINARRKVESVLQSFPQNSDYSVVGSLSSLCLCIFKVNLKTTTMYTFVCVTFELFFAYTRS